MTSKIRTKTQRAKTSRAGKSGRRVLSQERENAAEAPLTAVSSITRAPCRKVIGVPGQRFAGSWEWRRLRQLAGPFDITEHPSATPNYAVATNAAAGRFWDRVRIGMTGVLRAPTTPAKQRVEPRLVVQTAAGLSADHSLSAKAAKR